MTIDRRTVLSGLATALAAPRVARAAGEGDRCRAAWLRPRKSRARVRRRAAGRNPALHLRARACCWAGRAARRRRNARSLAPGACDKPEVGRLTGRGNTTNLEVLLNLKPDLILGCRHHQRHLHLARQPHPGRRPAFPMRCSMAASTRIASTYRKLGELTHRAGGTPKHSRATPTTRSRRSRGRIDEIPKDKRPRVYYARGPRGLETGLGGSINVETIEFFGARNVAGERKGGMATVSIEQVLALESRCHHHHRPALRGEPCAAMRCGRRSRR